MDFGKKDCLAQRSKPTFLAADLAIDSILSWHYNNKHETSKVWWVAFCMLKILADKTAWSQLPREQSWDTQKESGEEESNKSIKEEC